MVAAIQSGQTQAKGSAQSTGGWVPVSDPGFSDVLQSLNWGVKTSLGSEFLRRDVLAPFKRYSAEAKIALDESPFAPMLPEITRKIEKLSAAIDKMQSRGGTNYTAAQNELADLENKVKSEIILSSNIQNTSEAQAKIEHFQSSLLRMLPNASYIDLSILSALKLANGLPRLGLFDPLGKDKFDYFVTTRECGKTSRDTSREKFAIGTETPPASGREIIPASIIRDIPSVIEEATGVFVTGSTKNAEDIYISAQYTGPVVPKELKKFIAKSKSLFDAVQILSPVSGWSVFYEKLWRARQPKIEEGLPKMEGGHDHGSAQDLLVIGFKFLPKIVGLHPEGRLLIEEDSVPFLIGAIRKPQDESWSQVDRLEDLRMPRVDIKEPSNRGSEVPIPLTPQMLERQIWQKLAEKMSKVGKVEITLPLNKVECQGTVPIDGETYTYGYNVREDECTLRSLDGGVVVKQSRFGLEYSNTAAHVTLNSSGDFTLFETYAAIGRVFSNIHSVFRQECDQRDLEPVLAESQAQVQRLSSALEKVL